jgi:hypothetical protein
LIKEGIKTPEDLLQYLFRNKEKYPEDAVSRSIANLIADKSISADNIKSHLLPAGKGKLWIILWVLLGVGILGLLLLLWRKKKNQNK